MAHPLTGYFHKDDLVEFRSQDEIDYLVSNELINTIDIPEILEHIGGKVGKIKSISDNDGPNNDELHILIRVSNSENYWYDARVLWYPKKYQNLLK